MLRELQGASTASNDVGDVRDLVPHMMSHIQSTGGMVHLVGHAQSTVGEVSPLVANFAEVVHQRGRARGLHVAAPDLVVHRAGQGIVVVGLRLRLGLRGVAGATRPCERRGALLAVALRHPDDVVHLE